jgi:tRNA pseudouridine55 synthase
MPATDDTSPKEGSILLVDKPTGVSSYDVIRILKKKFPGQKIGHAGTLDPMATGLLIVLLGKATKRFDEFQGVQKEYIADITFGQKTDTYDADGKVIWEYGKPFGIDTKTLEEVLMHFTGTFDQTPPAHSAVKINGKRAYELARKEKEVMLSPRPITVYESELLSIEGKTARVRFLVSSGTYIRSLAYDIGEKFGVGAYLSALRRTKIGEYSIAGAKKPEDF